MCDLKKSLSFFLYISLLLQGCASTPEVESPAQTGQLKMGNYTAARAALAEGDYDTAGRELRLVLQANPLDARAHYTLC